MRVHIFMTRFDINCVGQLYARIQFYYIFVSLYVPIYSFVFHLHIYVWIFWIHCFTYVCPTKLRRKIKGKITKEYVILAIFYSLVNVLCIMAKSIKLPIFFFNKLIFHSSSCDKIHDMAFNYGCVIFFYSLIFFVIGELTLWLQYLTWGWWGSSYTYLVIKAVFGSQLRTLC